MNLIQGSWTFKEENNLVLICLKLSGPIMGGNRITVIVYNRKCSYSYWVNFLMQY